MMVFKTPDASFQADLLSPRVNIPVNMGMKADPQSAASGQIEKQFGNAVSRVIGIQFRAGAKGA